MNENQPETKKQSTGLSPVLCVCITVVVLAVLALLTVVIPVAAAVCFVYMILNGGRLPWQRKKAQKQLQEIPQPTSIQSTYQRISEYAKQYENSLSGKN